MTDSSKTDGSSRVKECRGEISSIDREVLKLLAKRREISREVAKAKEIEDLPLRDLGREEELLANLISEGRSQNLDAHFVTSVFHNVIDDSLRVQQEYLQSQNPQGNVVKTQTVKIVVHGLEGSHAAAAAAKHFAQLGGQAQYLFAENLEEAVRELSEGKSDFAVIAEEGVQLGAGLHHTYRLLLNNQLVIVGEERIKVSHSLVGLSDVSLSNLLRVYVDSETLAQSGKFLRSIPRCEVCCVENIAQAIAKIKEGSQTYHAAICSDSIAQRCGLKILKQNVADQEFMRFIFVAREAQKINIRIPCKTSLLLTTDSDPTSAVNIMAKFGAYDLHLSRMESRVDPEDSSKQLYFVDFEGNIEDPQIKSLLADLSKHASFVRVLGCYALKDLPKAPVRSVVLAAINRTDSVAPVESAQPAALASVPMAKKAEEPKVKSSGHRLASRQHKSETSVIKVKGVELGGEEFVVIAGPCAVESRDQIMICAREAKEHGAQILRGGCFKPRTSPYSFQGLGYQGLEYLQEAGLAVDLPVITELLSQEDLYGVAEKSDIIQIGARNMQNFSLLKAVGKINRPIMLKRGMMASLDELLHAAEYILAQGNQQVFLCERGIRTFETSTRNTLDLSAVPVLKQMTHLPIFVDPSHAVGERDLVAPMAKAAKAVGAHGIMIEFHPKPEEALSDGPQALRFPQFEELMSELLPRSKMAANY